MQSNTRALSAATTWHTLAQRWYLRDLVFLLAAALLVTVYVRVADGGFPLDDSWIHQVYARNLAARGEWAFVPGEPSGASTSPLYTVLLAVGYALRIPYAFWTHVLGVLALTFTAMIGARMAQHLVPDQPLVGWVAGLTLILTWHLIWAAASGMETMLFGMFTLLVISTVWSNMLDAGADLKSAPMHSKFLREGAFFGGLAALMTMIRPEGVMLAVICGGFSVMILMSGSAPIWQWCIGALLGFGVVLAPYLLLNLHLTGGILPATAAAKYAQHVPLLQKPYLARVWDMTVPILAGGQVLLVPGMLYLAVRNVSAAQQMRQALLLFVPILWIIGLIMLYAARLPASYQHGRYVMPVLPAWIVIGVVGTYQLSRRGQNHLVGRVLLRSLVIAAVLVFVYMCIYGAAIYRQDVRIIDEEMVASAHWIAEHIPPDELLAVHDIGAVGYFAPRPILDIAGLVSEDVMPLVGNDAALWELLRVRKAHYLMAFPDQIPGQNPADSRLCPVFQSDGRTTLAVGGPKMVVYALAWHGVCPV